MYTRLSWNTQLARLSQHAVLASQTLGDLYDVIPCAANEIPGDDSQSQSQSQKGWDERDGEEGLHKGAVVCIEGVAYGDGQSEEDYSE